MSNHNIQIKAGNIIDTIGSLYNSLTPSSKRIADYVMSNATQVSKHSIAELSQIVNAGDATIIRFCRTLGFKGYQDFKMELAIEVSNLQGREKEIFDTDVTAEDNAEVIGHKLQSTIESVLAETMNLLNFQSLESVAEALKDAKAIYFFGVGSSGLTAESAKHKFMRIGLNVDAFTNNHFMYIKSSLMQPGDFAVGLSHSGNSVETTKALRLAKENGATTIAITHNPRSDITKYSDYVLVNGNRQGQLQGDSIGTKISQLFVLDLIYTLLVKRDISGAKANKLKTTEALSNQS
ncbi:SIS domain-containing protein [Aliivibrio fischeri]|uniref:N-acetylmannosamine kinase n=3 Tax=Aliivibrio fischeri TaxID=668 RepID=A0A1B9PLC4_ALIFS|nr:MULTISPECIES: MurR/RpiR family transcriptional regulator [Aliivibrio]ACH65934.1 transcriptional regulator, RpiR family [Aliivibrio fischeri MJ11]EHN70889.1 putative transcriptional regulator [Aliivibrio fischeri SR5]MBD1568374.1 MurR/RpiR family transcriptional regulator [Aliivibrio sp. S10_S31]MCE4936693.1 MurR/RpiR family transcriptional regulator [Aliivibrio fischeri]MUJ20945.1 SIS domain-containing protein [Aliivibrio fischeri]